MATAPDVAAPAALAFEDLLEGRPVTRTMTTMDAGCVAQPAAERRC